MQYTINDIYTCIQGEGSLAGTPMILVRTQGCKVGCKFCDTKETWEVEQSNCVAEPSEAFSNRYKWCEMNATEIADYCQSLNAQSKAGYEWILLTGGEPAEQDCLELLQALSLRGFKIAIETSGTSRGHLPLVEGHLITPDHICVSPKMKMNVPIDKEVCGFANELKFIVGTEQDIQEINLFLSTLTFKFDDYKVYLQPMSTSPKATKICVEACKNYGYKLSLQTHKWIEEK